MNVRSRVAAFVAVACVAAACSLADQVSAATSTAPTAMPDACAKEKLALVTPGTLTIAANNLAFAPWFFGDPAHPAWDYGNPNNGKGFESAVAFAIADSLGFAAGEVTWIPIRFNNGIDPDDKDFDFYLSQVSFSPERAQANDLSEGYFDVSEAIVGLADNPIANVTTVAELDAFRLGVPVGTTSYQYVVDNIKPTQDPLVYDTFDAALDGLSNDRQIDGLVVDLHEAFFITKVGLRDVVIVGTLPTVGEVEHFSVVLELGSALTPCVNAAIAAITADGQLQAITHQWITGQGAHALIPRAVMDVAVLPDVGALLVVALIAAMIVAVAFRR